MKGYTEEDIGTNSIMSEKTGALETKLSDKAENGGEVGSASFEEDNNPFKHDGGLASLMTSQGAMPVVLDAEDDESIHLYATENTKSKDTYKAVLMECESRVSKLLKPESEVKILISDAGNSNEGSVNLSKKYIVYTIKLIDVTKGEEILTRRRYSDFESLREILTKVFPLMIIPPIPVKNYFNFKSLVGENSTNGSNPQGYSYINSSQLNKTKLIEHRKRLLTNFLNNCLQILPIRNLEFFAKFLDPNANWSDEINLMMSQLPKSIYNSNPENALKTDAIYANLPNPIPNQTISFLNKNKKKLTKKVNGSSQSSTPSSIIDTSSLDYLNKKIMENFIGLSNDYADLGTTFNSFSLMLVENDDHNDDVKINIIFDKIGQIFDRSYLTINSLVSDLETKFLEPLGEAVQYTATLQEIVKFQTRKQKQKHLLDSEIEDKRRELNEISSSDKDSAKVETAINNQGNSKASHKTYNLNDQESVEKSPSSKFKLFSIKKITQYVNEIIDQNPQETRKQRSITLKDKIVTLEKCQNIMLEDLSYITDEINKNFQIFRAKQLKQIYDILVTYNGFLIGWAKKNIEIWEEIREEISKL